MSYWRLHYHIVWSTDAREPLIDAPRQAVIQRTLSGKTHELRIFLHATGGTADHVHVVVSIPPTLAVAECVRQFKGATTHAVNHTLPAARQFRWQRGYGALSLSERHLAVACDYARNQERHHAQSTVIAAYQRSSGDEDPLGGHPTQQ